MKVALKQVKLDETLIIVTADHSHSFTVNGYPARGNDILGLASNMGNTDGQRYETLTYANGPGFFTHRRNDSKNVNETWIDLEEGRNRDNIFYMHMAGQYLKDDTHGGEDVGVYAIGNYIYKKGKNQEIIGCNQNALNSFYIFTLTLQFIPTGMEGS